MKNETVFQRYEFKYLLTRDQQARLLAAAGEDLRPDVYSHSSIRNLYLDTPDFRLIRRSLEKPVYKEKLRLRSYGRTDRDSPVFMELKKKYRSIVYKRRLTLPYDRALDCLTGACPWPETQIGGEIRYTVDFYPDLESRVFLAYERDSWLAPESGLRITFDDAIRFRTEELTLDSDPAGAGSGADGAEGPGGHPVVDGTPADGDETVQDLLLQIRNGLSAPAGAGMERRKTVCLRRSSAVSLTPS